MQNKTTAKEAAAAYVSSLTNTALLKWLVLFETKTVTALKRFAKEVSHEWLNRDTSACYEGRLASSILKVLKKRLHKRFKRRKIKKE